MAKRILVVDDEKDIVDVAKTFLVSRGYEVSTASNGNEAIAKASSERPDLMLLDILMPGKNGFEVTRALKKDPATAGIPIVISSVLAGVKDRKEALESGAIATLAKPFEFEIVAAQIKNILEMSQLRMFKTLSDVSLPTFMFHVLNSTAVEAENLFGTGTAFVFLQATQMLGKQIVDLYSTEWNLSEWTPELLGEAAANLVGRLGGTAKLVSSSPEAFTVEMAKSPFGEENIRLTNGRLCEFVWNVFPAMATASKLADKLLRVDHPTCIGRGDDKCTLVTRLGKWETRPRLLSAPTLQSMQ
jgi:twitching motility two-component system response regulator PilH